jgi:DNA (cytosine-5)-methyltransferase 1
VVLVDFPGWPARPGEDQRAYEPPRTVQTETPDYDARLKAIGNAVVPEQAYPLFASIREWIETQGLELAA